MKELIKKLAGGLYSYLGGDLSELTRRANHLLTSDIPKVDPETEKLPFLKAMLTLHDSKELDWLIAQICEDQKRLSFEEAKNELELNWGRATMNGCMLIKDRLKSYKIEYDDLVKREEVFDKHSVI